MSLSDLNESWWESRGIVWVDWYVPSRVFIYTWEKVIVRVEMKYMMENNETSMSPELTQDHSGDV